VQLKDWTVVPQALMEVRGQGRPWTRGVSVNGETAIPAFTFMQDSNAGFGQSVGGVRRAAGPDQPTVIITGA
jgi:hypothetical protein